MVAFSPVGADDVQPGQDKIARKQGRVGAIRLEQDGTVTIGAVPDHVGPGAAPEHGQRPAGGGRPGKAHRAIDEEGALLDFDYREVQVSQAIIANARSVMLVSDSSKFQRSAPVRIAHLSQIQTFVTDAALPPGLQAICEARGIEVIVAMPEKSEDLDGAEAETGAANGHSSAMP